MCTTSNWSSKSQCCSHIKQSTGDTDEYDHFDDNYDDNFDDNFDNNFDGFDYNFDKYLNNSNWPNLQDNFDDATRQYDQQGSTVNVFVY